MGAVGVIIERIPHKDVSYAYLEIQASNANEFESLREEALKKIPQYAFALEQPSAPKSVAVAEVAAEESPASGDASTTAPPEQASATAAPTSTEGLSPREIARQRLAQKGA